MAIYNYHNNCSFHWTHWLQKNQISAKVFCYCPILIREKTAGQEARELTKNFGGHLVFSKWFLVESGSNEKKKRV